MASANLPGPNPFQTDEPLWFDNGRWGEAGYAVPNPAGKTWTNNPVIFGLHTAIGRTMFELMHRQEAKFFAAPHKQFFWDLHQMVVTARKRLADRMIAPNTDNAFVPKHVNPVPQVFLVYPVPFFGGRIRQLDIREYCSIALMLLSEMMQHSDNERTSYISREFAATMGGYLRELMILMGTKYFGYTREEASADNFVIADDRFSSYDPAKVLFSVEMTEERQPLQWWPTENDLSLIRETPINEALLFCKRWPQTNWLNEADGNVTVGPLRPDSTGSAADALANAGFVASPNAAP